MSVLWLRVCPKSFPPLNGIDSDRRDAPVTAVSDQSQRCIMGRKHTAGARGETRGTTGGIPEAGDPQRPLLSAAPGCSWCLLPPALPLWWIVSHDFRPWRQDHTWQVRHDLLRGDGRTAAGKWRQPRAGFLDSLSVKTTGRRAPWL
jgi:hypothetical protein